jgi:hypothetical protein
MRSPARTFALTALVLLAAQVPNDRAAAGLGFPGTRGHASPTGVQPCTPCAPGTFAPGFGATACDPCPDRTAATGSGAFQCDSCVCDDGTACTHDSCEPDTAACTAKPVAGCEEVLVEVTGVVETVFDASSPVDVGMPVAGTYSVDPLAPDSRPDDPELGRYPSAGRSLDFRVGDPAVFVATSVGANRIDVWREEENYSVLFGIDVTTPPDGDGVQFQISLTGTDSIVDDALLVVPDIASFESVVLDLDDFDVQQLFFPLFRSSITSLTAPEPDGPALALGAFAALSAVATARTRERLR